MGKEFGNQAGVLEAKWSTRNAFTGHKDAHDMRSQKMGNPNESLKAFTPGQLRDKESLVGLSHGADFKKAKQAEENQQLLAGSRLAFQDVMRADARMQAEPQMWAAYDRMISKEAKQQVLKTIEAKMDQVEQVQTSAMEKVQATAQIQVETAKLLAQAPVEVIAGGVGLALLWVVSRLPISGVHKALGMAAVLSIVLAACGTAAGTPNPEVPTQGGSVATEVSGGQVTEAPTDGAVEPTTDANEALVSASLQQDPDYDNTYVQYVEKQKGQTLTKEGAAFKNDIGVNGKGIVDDQYVTIGVDSYGILYAEHVDKEVFVFNIQDSAGSYLIGTKQEAFDRLSAENPSAVAGKTIDDFTLTTDVVNGVLLSLVDNATSKPMEGINAQTRQWSAIDNNGVLVGGPAAVPTETIGAETSDTGLLETDPEVNLAMVNDFASGAIEFPTDMTKEQYADFIDGMNDKVGRQPIYVETVNGSGAPMVLYFDIAKNRMMELPGSYAENKAVIDQNVMEMFVKISVEPGTGNIQFVNSKGELVTSPNSAGIDWSLRVDDTNYKNGLIDLPTVDGDPTPGAFFDHAFAGNGNMNATLIPGILMDDTVSQVVSHQNGWNRYSTLDIMFIRPDKTGNPAYGVRTMVGPSPLIFLGTEGGTMNGFPSKALHLIDSDDIDQFDAGSVYYIGMAENQQIMWDEANMADIDELQGTGTENSSFDNAMNEPVPDDGNIILAASYFIKKK